MADRSQMWDGAAWVGMTGLESGTSSEYLPLAGGTMTGFLTLHADPTAALHSATKQYVDAGIGAIPPPVPQTYLHASLTDVSADQHHTRYTDAEAVAVIGTPWTAYLPLTGGVISGSLQVDGGITNGIVINSYDLNPSGAGDVAWYQTRNIRFKDTAGPPDNAEGMDGDVCLMYNW